MTSQEFAKKGDIYLGLIYLDHWMEKYVCPEVTVVKSCDKIKIDKFESN